MSAIVTAPRHTPKQWRELVARLTAIRDNHAESSERRSRAEAILAVVRRTPEAQEALRPPPPPRPADLTWTEMDF